MVDQIERAFLLADLSHRFFLPARGNLAHPNATHTINIACWGVLWIQAFFSFIITIEFVRPPIELDRFHVFCIFANLVEKALAKYYIWEQVFAHLSRFLPSSKRKWYLQREMASKTD